MQNSNRNTIIAIGLCLLLLFAWGPIMNHFWPPPPKKPRVFQESLMLVTGSLAGSEPKVVVMPRLAPPEVAKADDKQKENEPKKDPVVAKSSPKEAPDLIAMGHGGRSHLRVLLNTWGGAVQRVVATQFDEADRLGLRVTRPGPDGKPQGVPLPLVPGVQWKREMSLRAQKNYSLPDIEAGKMAVEGGEFKDPKTGVLLSSPSYVMYHYENPGDERPVDTLGSRNWKVVEQQTGEGHETERVVFETELGAPYNLKIRKVYTLARNENHIGLKVEFARTDAQPTGELKFRYQITGAHGMPIEGEWYNTTFHVAITGFEDRAGNPTRAYEDSREIRFTEGGERLARTGARKIRFAGTAVQYFASVLAVDNEQPDGRQDFLEFVRSTPFGPHHKEQSFLDDCTVRAISEEMKIKESATHQFLLYQGPVKVRLLRQLEGEKAVPDALVDRYLDVLHLGVLTDAPMPNALGRFANAIFWTDIVIAFTNVIHGLLWLLYQVVPNLGICILLVTVIVRGMLFPLSRKQALHAQVMQQKMAKLSPELKKIQEKYAGDFHRIMQERNKLYLQHGINPASALRGCLPLLIQMPIFMGLYYALQESVYFRLEPFLWMPNLSAPDMLVWWGEGIPILSTPDNMGSGLYLGPFLNILPIVAVVLMLYQQKKMMPQTDDPQVQAQFKMMKWMMILFGLFFYKVAAGLCIYFIASSVWGIVERRMLPKIAKPGDPGYTPPSTAVGLVGKNAEKDHAEDDAEPKGWWGRLKARWRARWKEVLEQAQKQAEHRNQPRPQRDDQRRAAGTPGAPEQPRRGGQQQRKKKKKR